MDNIKGAAFVPYITDETLQALIKRFAPLYRDEEGVIWKMKLPHLRNSGYTWDPDLTETVEFETVAEEQTDHYAGYVGFFKPSIAEVLSQIPADIPEECNAFYIDTDSIAIYSEGNGHAATTVFGVIK